MNPETDSSICEWQYCCASLHKSYKVLQMLISTLMIIPTLMLIYTTMIFSTVMFISEIVSTMLKGPGCWLLAYISFTLFRAHIFRHCGNNVFSNPDLILPKSTIVLDYYAMVCQRPAVWEKNSVLFLHRNDTSLWMINFFYCIIVTFRYKYLYRNVVLTQ